MGGPGVGLTFKAVANAILITQYALVDVAVEWQGWGNCTRAKTGNVLLQP